MPLLVHGEVVTVPTPYHCFQFCTTSNYSGTLITSVKVTTRSVDIFDREAQFIEVRVIFFTSD